MTPQTILHESIRYTIFVEKHTRNETIGYILLQNGRLTIYKAIVILFSVIGRPSSTRPVGSHLWIPNLIPVLAPMLRRAFSTYVVRMPRLSHVMKDGTVAKWYAQVEDHVDPHGLLGVVATDSLFPPGLEHEDIPSETTSSSLMELELVDEGVVAAHLVSPGVPVPVDAPIAVICDDLDEARAFAIASNVTDQHLDALPTALWQAYKTSKR